MSFTAKLHSVLDQKKEMKGSVFYVIFLFNYCYSEKLLGGWSVSSDESLKSECLDKALIHLNGAQISNEIRTEASDVSCQTQIVNGLNIKCTFKFRGKKHQCSYYKSFIQTLETQLEQCKEIDEQPVVRTQDPENSNNRDEPLIVEEKDDEKEQDEEQQPTQTQEEQSPLVDEDNKEDEGGQRAGANLNSEEDGEAAIDQLNQKLSDQASNVEDEPQQQEQQK